MLAKSWKKICLVILIIACLWNIISKVADLIALNEQNKENEKESVQQTNSVVTNEVQQ